MSPCGPDHVDVTVWCAPPFPVDSGTAALLPSVEVDRAGRFRRVGDRARFTTARALARAALGEVLGLPGRAVGLRIGAADGRTPGRPFVVDGPSFSISHAGSWVLVAVVAAPRGGVDVGVDVESPAAVGRHLDAVAGAVPDEERPAGGWTTATLARSWVRREAVLKAVGTGLLAQPDGLVLSAADGPPAVARTTSALPSPARLALRDLDLPPVGPGATRAGHAPESSLHLAALGLCATGPAGLPLPDVTVADGCTLLARHGVRTRTSATFAET